MILLSFEFKVLISNWKVYIKILAGNSVFCWKDGNPLQKIFLGQKHGTEQVLFFLITFFT